MHNQVAWLASTLGIDLFVPSHIVMYKLSGDLSRDAFVTQGLRPNSIGFPFLFASHSSQNIGLLQMLKPLLPSQAEGEVRPAALANFEEAQQLMESDPAFERVLPPDRSASTQELCVNSCACWWCDPQCAVDRCLHVVAVSRVCCHLVEAVGGLRQLALP